MNSGGVWVPSRGSNVSSRSQCAGGGGTQRRPETGRHCRGVESRGVETRPRWGCDEVGGGSEMSCWQRRPLNFHSLLRLEIAGPYCPPQSLVDPVYIVGIYFNEKTVQASNIYLSTWMNIHSTNIMNKWKYKHEKKEFKKRLMQTWINEWMNERLNKSIN